MGPAFIKLWLGAGFEPAGTALRLFAVAVAINLTSAAAGFRCIGQGWHRIAAASALVNILLNGILSFILAAAIGFNGPLIGSIVGNAAGVIFSSSSCGGAPVSTGRFRSCERRAPGSPLALSLSMRASTIPQPGSRSSPASLRSWWYLPPRRPSQNGSSPRPLADCTSTRPVQEGHDQRRACGTVLGTRSELVRSFVSADRARTRRSHSACCSGANYESPTGSKKADALYPAPVARWVVRFPKRMELERFLLHVERPVTPKVCQR